MHRVRYLIGILTLVAAVAGAFWIVRLLQQLDDRPGVTVHVEFRDARGLRAGAAVRYRGVHAGTVREVAVADDGGRAVVRALLDPEVARHARVNSSFWIVTPRFAGIAAGATGLDTLVRDVYLAFQTPDVPGSALASGSLVAGKERPPAANEAEKVDELEHGDLVMHVLLPENHGLRAGSAVTFRGIQTGEVSSVELADDGSHVVAQVRILRQHRQTVTDKAVFWVARPQLSGALFTGFRVDDASALLQPFVSYYGVPGEGLPVENGYRAVARAARPDVEVADVPPAALRRERPPGAVQQDGVVVVRVVYAAIERDSFSPDDPVHCEGSGLLLLDRDGRAVVVTARNLVDGTFSERDAVGGDPEITDEQIKVMLPSGAVLHAGRVWVQPEGADLAALVLTETPAELRGTQEQLLKFEAQDGSPSEPPFTLRRAAPDGSSLPPEEFDPASPQPPTTHLGAAALANGRVFGIYGRNPDGLPIIVALQLLPADLRPK